MFHQNRSKMLKPGSRGAIEMVLAHYNLRLDSYRMGKVRLYAVECDVNYKGGGHEGYRLSDHMTFDQLKRWAQGFIEGKEGTISTYI